MFQATPQRHRRSVPSHFARAQGGIGPKAHRLRLESLEPRMMLSATAGTWTRLTNPLPTNYSPNNNGSMELLSNGSVLNGAIELTPSATGSYVNGTWSAVAGMSELRLYDDTQVLSNGNVMVLGGEYTGVNYTFSVTDTGEIYNPVTNVWTPMAPYPGQWSFGYATTVMLPDGDVLAGRTNGTTFIYDPTSNTWLTDPALYDAATGTYATTPALTKPDLDESADENWTQLPNGNIMSVDNWNNVGQVEIFDTTTMSWGLAGANTLATTLPNFLAGGRAGGFIGAATLLPNGEVFQLGGANSLTALYNPSTNTWTAGPTLPNGLDTIESSAAMLPNGDVLFSAGGTVDGPIHFFEYNPTATRNSPGGTLTDVSPSFSKTASSQPFVTRMVALPTGQVLAVVPGGAAGELYVYTPVGSPQTAWKPTITSVVANANGDGNYTLTGTQLNGLSAGASQGPNVSQEASNYPIVELTSASGQVYFARTFNWSSAGVATGNTPETTEFSLPAGMPSGTYKVSVVANGIASSPLSMFFTAIPTADLAVTDVGPSSVTVGDNGDTPTEVSYTITLTNNSAVAATDVLLSDSLPAGSTLVSFTQTSGSDSFTLSQPQANVVTAAIPSIPALGSDTFTLTVSAPVNLYNGEVFSNSATVTTNASDPTSSNNTATATGSIVNVSSDQSSNLVVTDVGLGGTPLQNIYGPQGSLTEGGQATYFFTVMNNGPTDAPNVVLTDVLGERDETCLRVLWRRRGELHPIGHRCHAPIRHRPRRPVGRTPRSPSSTRATAI